MRKLLRGVLAASMLFGSSTVFADDKASDIRKQILELTKELAEVSQTEGDITYDLVNTDSTCDYIVAKLTNNYDYSVSIQPYVIVRNEDGEIIFASSATSYDSIDSGETVMVETNTYKDLSNVTYEWGTYVEPTNRKSISSKIQPVVTEDNDKLRIELESDLTDDDIINIALYVLYYKEDKLVDLEYEWSVELDDISTIKYDGVLPYDRYEVYIEAIGW